MAKANCQTCHDLGIVRKRVELNHPDFGRTFPCPARCEAALKREKDHIERSMKYMFKFHGQMSGVGLDGVSIEDFAVEGKWLAASMVKMWSMNMGEFSVADGIRYGGYNPKGYDETPSPSLILVGEVGTGKTTLAALAGIEINKRGGNCLMVRFDALYNMVKDTFGEGSGHSESDILRTVSRVPHLILDELINNPSEYMRRVLEQVIDYRVNHRLPTLYTTNLDDTGMYKAWGDRIASRVLTAHLINVGGETYRRRAKLVTV